MLKWLFTLAMALLVLGLMTPLLTKLGLGRLPGDMRVRRKGQQFFFPLTSTILMSLLLTLLFWFMLT